MNKTFLQHAVIFLLMAAVTALLHAGSYHAMSHRANKAPTLPAPTRQLDPSPQGLDAVLSAANSDTPALFQRTIRVPYENVTSFLQHLRLAAAQRGWFFYAPQHHDAILVMPAEELSSLDDLTISPTAWVIRQNAQVSQAQGPSSLNLVTVDINIHQDGAQARKTWQVLGIFGFMAAAILTVATIVRPIAIAADLRD